MTIHRKIFQTYKEAYSGLPREAWLLSVVEFVNRSGTMVIFFMTLYLTQTFGFTTSRAGQVISAYGLGALLGSYLGGKLSDLIGPINVLKISLTLAGISYILLGFLNSYISILIMMFLVGLISEAGSPANSTAMSNVCPLDIRTKGFALRRLATNLGITFGPALGGTLAMINYHLLFWVDGITCLAAVFLLILFFKNKNLLPLKNEVFSSQNHSIWKDLYFLKILGLAYLIGLIIVQIFNTFPLFLRTIYHLPENHIGFLLAINTILIVLFEMVLINALRNKSMNKIIALGSLLLGTGFALLPYGRGFLFAAFTVVVWTTGEMLSLPTLTALIANHSNDAVRGKYMGLFSVSFALAISTGPALGAAIYDKMGPDILWTISGILGIILFTGFLRIKKEPGTV